MGEIAEPQLVLRADSVVVDIVLRGHPHNQLSQHYGGQQDYRSSQGGGVVPGDDVHQPLADPDEAKGQGGVRASDQDVRHHPPIHGTGHPQESPDAGLQVFHSLTTPISIHFLASFPESSRACSGVTESP